LFEQRLVVLLRRLERVRAHDRLARVVAVAVAPRRGARRVVADQTRAVAGPEALDRERAVAAEVARIAPRVAVRVEVVGREQVPLERLDAGRRLARRRRADELPVAEATRADPLEAIDVVRERRRSADADEADVRHLLRARG